MATHRLTTGIASAAMLLPAACKRPPAEVVVPDGDAEPVADQAVTAASCPPCATPKPPPGSPDDHEPPTVLGARFVARDRLQLTFSEALAAVEGVNPRQFRLSHAYSVVEVDGKYATGTYYDLGGGDSYDPPVVVVELELYADRPEVLALSLNRPIPVELCEDLAQTKLDLQAAANEPEGPQQRVETGLYLHYTSRGSDGIRDKVNNPLADMGGEWALHFGARHKQVYGDEPVVRLDLLLEVPCPDASLGMTGGPPGPT